MSANSRKIHSKESPTIGNAVILISTTLLSSVNCGLAICNLATGTAVYVRKEKDNRCQVTVTSGIHMNRTGWICCEALQQYKCM